MSDEQDSIKEELKEYKITPDEIVENTIPSTELYDILIGDEIISPFWRETIQKQIEVGSPLFSSDLKIRSMGTQDWTNLFEHPTFQRRKPSIVAEPIHEEEEEGASFLILSRGQKVGPFSLRQLREKVETKEVLATDIVSQDNGQNWIKLFEMPEFDRRQEARAENLPHIPKDNVFNSSKLEVLDSLKASDSENETIYNLVNLGRKQSEQAAPVHSTPIQEKDSDEELFNEKTVSIILIIISLIGIGYFAKEQFAPSKKQIAKSRRAKKKARRNVTRRAAPQPETRTRRADAPPPPPDRAPERPPRRESTSRIKRDAPPRMPRKMQDRPLIDDRNDDRRYGDDTRRRDDRGRSRSRRSDSLDRRDERPSRSSARGQDDRGRRRDIAEDGDFSASNQERTLDRGNEENMDRLDDQMDNTDRPPEGNFEGEQRDDPQDVY